MQCLSYLPTNKALSGAYPHEHTYVQVTHALVHTYAMLMGMEAHTYKVVNVLLVIWWQCDLGLQCDVIIDTYVHINQW